MRDRLRLPVDWNVLMIESLMMHDGLTIGLTVGYIAVSEDQSCGIDVEGQDVISILERQLGIRIGPPSRTTVGAVAADEQTADLIGVDVGAPTDLARGRHRGPERTAKGAVPAPAAR